MKSLPRPAEIFERYGLVILLGAVVVFFALNANTPQFDSSANIDNILANESLLGIVVIATVIPLVAGQIDLSVGPAAGLSSLLCAGMMSKSGLPLVPAASVGIATGLVIGLVNGLLVAKAHINSIVTTLGTSSIIGAMVLAYSGGVSIVSDISPRLTDLGAGEWLGLPRPFFFLLATALIVWYVLEHTPPGKNLYAAGSSPRAAELVGLGVPRLVLGSFVAAGAIAGAAGVLLVAVQGAGNPEIGTNFTLPAIAAAFLGATAIRPGRYNVGGSVTAVFFLAISVNGLTLWGAASWVSDVFNGVALIVGVGIAVYSGRRRLANPRARNGSQPTAEAPDAVGTEAERESSAVA